MARTENRWSLEGVIATVYLTLAGGVAVAVNRFDLSLPHAVEPLQWVLFAPALWCCAPPLPWWLTLPFVMACNSVVWGYTLAYLWRRFGGARHADDETPSVSAPEGQQAGPDQEGAPAPRAASASDGPPTGLVPQGIGPLQWVTRILVVVCLLLAGGAVCVLALG